MARIRTIKPDFWSDGKNVNLSPLARLLFIGSWNFALCDDGHLPDDAFGLKLKVLPADDVDPDELLSELLFSGQLVRGTTADGRSYLHIPRLRDHQKVDGRWTPRCFVCSQEPAGTQPNSSRLTETRASLDEFRGDSPQEGKGKEGKVKEPSSSKPDYTDLFAEFWNHYPRKEAKAAALKAWTKVTKTVDPQTIIAGVAAYTFNPDPQFRPLGATWLNGKRWEDERPALGGASDRRLTGSEIEGVLGPDHWTCPAPPASVPVAEHWEWQQKLRLEHINERQQQARARLGATA